MPPCLTLIIKYGSRVSGAIQEKELHPPLPLGVVAIKRKSFQVALTTVGQPTYICIQIYTCEQKKKVLE